MKHIDWLYKSYLLKQYHTSLHYDCIPPQATYKIFSSKNKMLIFCNLHFRNNIVICCFVSFCSTNENVIIILEAEAAHEGFNDSLIKICRHLLVHK